MRLKARTIIVVTRSWWWGGGGGEQQQGWTDADKDYCDDEVMMLRWTTARTKSSTFVWFPLREKRNVQCIIIIRMVPIVQYVIHCTRITILIATWHDIITSGCYSVIRVPVIRTDMEPSYKTIYSITQLYIYTWNDRWTRTWKQIQQGGWQSMGMERE